MPNIVTVQLTKPGKDTPVTYTGELVLAEPDHVLIHARWLLPVRDLGALVFAPGDHCYEHFYTDRWFCVFEVRDQRMHLKGWYGNVARPAHIVGRVITCDDLDLDLVVSADRQQIVRLDVDEFQSRGLKHTDPAAYTAALAALDEMEQLARHGQAPFSA